MLYLVRVGRRSQTIRSCRVLMVTCFPSCASTASSPAIWCSAALRNSSRAVGGGGVLRASLEYSATTAS